MSEAGKMQRDEHMRWLVESRSRNQRSSLSLHEFVTKHEEFITSEQHLTSAFYSLVAINFSLWRAVFLSELHESSEFLMRDAKAFLVNLISNNAVAYPQDLAAREWTFTYYMGNAQRRLTSISKSVPEILPASEFLNTSTADDKLWWNECQISMERALTNLTAMAEAKSSN